MSAAVQQHITFDKRGRAVIAGTPPAIGDMPAELLPPPPTPPAAPPEPLPPPGGR